MFYFCEICDKHICSKSKSKHFKSKSHIEINNCDYSMVSFNNVNIGEIDEI